MASTYNFGTAIAGYLNPGDLPVGAVFVTDQRPDRTVYLVLRFAS